MDKKLIRRYGEDILCYRIRTARHKKRMQFKDFDKHLIQLSREERELRKQKNNLGWEPLTPPVQKGWKRYFVLRDDVARSKQAVFFENILKKINTCDWSYRRDFLVKRRRFGRKIYVVKGQQLLQPDWYHFGKLEFADAEKQCFHEVWKMDWRRQPVKHYAFNEPWRFTLRTRPNMVDKVRKRDEVIERRIQEIDRYLEQNDLRKRQSKLLSGNYRWHRYEEKMKEKNPIKNIPLHQMVSKSEQSH